MNTKTPDCRHPVPLRYHKPLYIGKYDRRGNRIDFKGPPVVVETPRQISEYREMICAEHVESESLPMVYTEGFSFLVLRPTALPFRAWLRGEIKIENLSICEEFEIDNFMRFSDTLYLLDPSVKFHWQWRVIMRVLHDSGTQDQNRAIAFVLDNGKDRVETHQRLVSVKKKFGKIWEKPLSSWSRMESLKLPLVFIIYTCRSLKEFMSSIIHSCTHSIRPRFLLSVEFLKPSQRKPFTGLSHCGGFSFI